MTGNPGAGQRMLAIYASLADEGGGFAANPDLIAERLRINPKSASELLRRLVTSGAVERVSPGNFRVTGKPHVRRSPNNFVRRERIAAPPLAMEDDAPTEPTYRGGAPCSYATARACGIEPRVYLVPNRQFLNSTSGSHAIAVTLARIPCLERPLPREAA